MSTVLAGLYTMVIIVAFVAASMYVTGGLTTGDVTGLVGIS